MDFATATKHAQLAQNQAKMSETCSLTLFAIKAAYIVESTDYNDSNDPLSQCQHNIFSFDGPDRYTVKCTVKVDIRSVQRMAVPEMEQRLTVQLFISQ